MTRQATATTLLDAKASAEHRIAAIDQELSKLDEQRGELSLDFTLGLTGAEGKLRALGDKVRTLHAERDDLTAAIGAAGRRQAEESRKAEEARIQQLRKKQAGYRGERQRAYLKVREALGPLEAAIQEALDAAAELWSVTQQLHEPPDTKTKDRLTVFISRQLNEAGLTDFDRYGDLYLAVERDLTTDAT